MIDIERIDDAPQNNVHGNKTGMLQPITTKGAVFKFLLCVSHKIKTHPVVQIDSFTADLLKQCDGLLPLFVADHACMVGTGGRVRRGAIRKFGPGVYERCIQNTCLFDRLGDAVDCKSDRTAFVTIVITVECFPRNKYTLISAKTRTGA